MPITNLISSPDDLTATTEAGGDDSNEWLTEFLFAVATVQQSATGIADPDGGGNAVELLLPAIGIVQNHLSYIRQSEFWLNDSLFTLGEVYRFDVAMKLNASFPDVEQCQLQLDTRTTTTTSVGRSCSYDLTDGTVVGQGGTAHEQEEFGVDDLGDGWYRIWFVFEYTFTVGTPAGVRVWLNPVGGNVTTVQPTTFPQRVFAYEPRLFLLSELNSPDPVDASTFAALQPEFYRDQLREHLPPGLAWTREPSANINLLLFAWAVEFYNVGERAIDLLTEKDPRTTLELITEWEELLGLPDPCVTNPSTDIDDRRTEIVAKLSEKGGQSIGFFVDLAAALGAGEIVIEEHGAFIAGESAAGDSVEVEEKAFVWTVHASINLSAAIREVLECTFGNIKPAHSTVVFVYDLDAYVEEPARVSVVAPPLTLLIE